MKLEKEPLGYQLKDFPISKIFDTNFLGSLGKQGAEYIIDHVTIEFTEPSETKSSSYVTIGYLTKKGKKEGRVTVTSSELKSLEYVLNALESVE